MSSDDQTRSPANAGSPARGPAGPPPTGVQAPTAYEAWLFARALAGLAFDHADPRLDAPSRPLARAMSDRDRGSRHEALDAHLATLADDDAGAWREALLAAAPDDPPPDDGWGMPLALTLLPVEPFPLDLYPRTVARLVGDGARAIGCPPDFLALTALAVAGAAVGRSASLRLKDGYFASAALFAACIGQPGDGKSPAVAVVVEPIARIEEDQFAAWKVEKELYEAELAARERAAKAGGRARPGRGRSEDECGDGRPIVDLADPPAPPPKPDPPTLGRSVVGDVTSEAMDVIMAQNPRGLLQVLDEASALTSSMNQYRGGKGSDRQWYLSTWSGQARIVDRKGNADNVPIRVAHPFLALVGGMVPDMIRSFCDERGRHDGFIDRFLFAFPDPIPKAGWSDHGIAPGVAAAWSEIVGRLRARGLRVEGARSAPHVVHFSADAKRAWAALIDAHHAEQRSFEFPASLAGPWAKLEQYAGRITLILHLLELAADPARDHAVIPDVSARTVGDAGRLLAYFKGHTHRVHHMMTSLARGGEGSDDAQAILKWLHRHRPESFSLRDLNRNLTRTFGKRTHALEEALGWLVGKRVIKIQASPSPSARKGPGRAKSSTYLVNPNLYAPQNGPNAEPTRPTPGGGGGDGDSGDFATDEDDPWWGEGGEDPTAP